MTTPTQPAAMTTQGKLRINLAGQKFGRLVALSPERLGGCTAWRCRCDCGKELIVRTDSLRSGASQSCRCWNAERVKQACTTHGHLVGGKKTATYRAWNDMLARCKNPNNKRYPNYGGRGIRACKRWEQFEHFLADMGERPQGLTLDRRNNNGNYTPSNCRWATRTEQNRNQRRNRMLTHNGETKCLAEWVEVVGVPRSTLRRRIQSRGWANAIRMSRQSMPAQEPCHG